MKHIPFDLELYRQQMRKYIGGKPDEHIFWDALDFAVEAHDDQWRRSGDAYILHPCSVAKILAAEMDILHPEILAAALLHDTSPDTFCEKAVSSEKAVLAFNAIRSAATTPEEQALRRFPRRRLKNLDTWPE